MRAVQGAMIQQRGFQSMKQPLAAQPSLTVSTSSHHTTSFRSSVKVPGGRKKSLWPVSQHSRRQNSR